MDNLQPVSGLETALRLPAGCSIKWTAASDGRFYILVDATEAMEAARNYKPSYTVLPDGTRFLAGTCETGNSKKVA